MKKIAVLLLAAVAGLSAQTAETVYFRALLLPDNEVPPTNIEASGTATIIAHLVRGTSGEIVDGSVDFLVAYRFPEGQTFRGLHIHSGTAGVNGPVTIDTGISGANPVVDETGVGMIHRQAQVMPDDTAGLATLRGMLNNPSRYYVNLHTTQFPGGAIRGQLQRADVSVFMGLMSPLNEVPPITTLDASGISHVRAITTRDQDGNFTSAQLGFNLDYRFPGQVTFTGFHIHTGPAGVNGPVIFDTGISGAAPVVSTPSGVGSLEFLVEVNLQNAAQRSALETLFTDPSALYINLHTTEFRGGAIRDQLRPTDTMPFNITLRPENEMPPVNVDALAPTITTIRTVRSEDGSILAGVAEFDVNFRFPGPAEFTGLHIHDGVAGMNGPVRVDTRLSGASPVVTETGFGNIFRSVNVDSGAALATLRSLSVNPENHYVNLHTRVNPGGAVRSQLAPANTAAPVTLAAIAGTLDVNVARFSPGSIISIFGTNLAKVTTDLSGWRGSTLPEQLNGVTVMVGGEPARLLFVSPSQINAVLSFDTPLGAQLLVVNNGNASAVPINVSIAETAPSLFFGPDGALAFKNDDFSMIGPANPARPGEVILLYSTGLGQVAPPLASGALAPVEPPSHTNPARVTIGGIEADVISSIAAPGFAGLYEAAVVVPDGVASGNAPVVLSVGGASSPPVNLAVQ